MKWRTMVSAAVLLFTAAATSLAQDPRHGSINGLDVFYGILPAEMVLGHELEHGGGKASRGAHHLVVAVFNRESRQRISNVEVEAYIEPLGMAGETKRLESMTINQTITFGNYFRMDGPGPYRITIRLRPPGSERWGETTFEYRHPAEE